MADDDILRVNTTVSLFANLSPFVFANRQILGEVKLIVQLWVEALTMDCPVIVKPAGRGILISPILFEVAVAVKFILEP